jgi:hypothetical protein
MTRVLISGWMIEAWRVTEPILLCFDSSRTSSFRERKGSILGYGTTCLPQNKSLSREKPCLVKVPVCCDMKEVAML